MQRRLTRTEFSDGYFSSGPPCPCALPVGYCRVFLLLAGFSPWLLFSHQMMDHLSSSASAVPSIDDYFEQNMWNPLLELLFLGQANGILASYLVEIDLAKIALSCHIALDLLCYKEEVLCFTVVRHGGKARRDVCCLLPLRRVAVDFCPLFHKPFFEASRIGIYSVSLFLFSGSDQVFTCS